ncbi:DUF4384 domain-containing protein [bacterium]|nr:MAG: DUF4384 domain-containing protein [bacterium]
MEEKLIKTALKEMKRKMPTTKGCPDDADLCQFVEGRMDEKASEGIEKHLLSCALCCDYVVSLNKVINFPEGEPLPEVPPEQIMAVDRLVKEKPAERKEKGSLFQSLKEFLSLDWLMQPMPVMVKSCATALVVLFMFTALYVYYQQSTSLGVQMAVLSKSGAITTRGTTGDKEVEKIIKEGDILYSNDFCRISFEVDKNAYAYILYYNSKGTLEQLYPDPKVRKPLKVMGKTTYVIPPGDDSWFQLDEQTGTETVFMVASEEPLSNLKEVLVSLQGSSREEVLKTLKSKAPVVKVLNFQHQ